MNTLAVALLAAALLVACSSDSSNGPTDSGEEDAGMDSSSDVEDDPIASDLVEDDPIASDLVEDDPIASDLVDDSGREDADVGIEDTGTDDVDAGITSCDRPEECSLGFCVDGVCCDQACDSPCRTCVTGTCAVVINAEDSPECTGEHRCDAAAACTLANGQGCEEDVECASRLCVDGFCCNTSCDDPCFSCSTGTCKSVRGADDDPECAGDYTCSMAAECGLEDGLECTDDDQCASGFCVDDTCCATACGEPCFSCTTGTCLAVTGGVDVPECAGTSTCDDSGACLLVDGEGCTRADDCLSRSCQDDTCCATACDDPCYSCVTGSCVAVVGADDEPECSGTRTCNASGVCGLEDGQPCTPEDDCASGMCVDGACCPEPCNGTCESCQSGVCLPVTSAADADTCTGTHTCNDAGECRMANGEGCGSNDDCASRFCADDICCDEACDSPCRSCVTGSCQVVINAEDSPQCVGDHICDAAATCTLVNGRGCEDDAECASRLCVDEICCNTSCDDPCFSCSTGICKSVRAADDDPECTGDYTCNMAALCGLKEGLGCSDGDDCASGFCEDDICCATACADPCLSCTTGACLAVTNGFDEPECVGTSTCDAFGACRFVDGEGCDGTEDCASGYCEDDTCCATTCGDPCYSCTTGACVAVTNGDDVPECTGSYTCNAAGACGLVDGQPCTPEDYCASELCVDLACCPEACDEPCRSCETGACLVVTNADDDPECTGTTTCNDIGQCLLADGEACDGDDNCASGFCVELVCTSPPGVTCETIPLGREDAFDGRRDDDETDPVTYALTLDQVRCWFSEPMQIDGDCFELASNPPGAAFGSMRQWVDRFTDDEVLLTPGFDPNEYADFQGCRDGLQRIDLVVLIPPDGNAYADWFVTLTLDLPGRTETIAIETETYSPYTAEEVAQYLADDITNEADHLVEAFPLGSWSNVIRVVGIEPDIRFSIETEVRDPSNDECQTDTPDCPAGGDLGLDPGWECHDPFPYDGDTDGFCRGPVCGSLHADCTAVLDQTPIAADPFLEPDPGDENLTEHGDGLRRDEIYLYGFSSERLFRLCIDHLAHEAYTCSPCVTVSGADPLSVGEALADQIGSINGTYDTIYEVRLWPWVSQFVLPWYGVDKATTVVHLEADSPSDEWNLTLEVELDGDNETDCDGNPCPNSAETCWDPNHDGQWWDSFCVDTCLDADGETWIRCDGSCPLDATACLDDWDEMLTSDVHCARPWVGQPGTGCTDEMGLNAETWLIRNDPDSALHAGGADRGGWDCGLPDGDTTWELQFGELGITACVARASGLAPAPYRYSFITADLEPPTLVSVSPGPGEVAPFGGPVVIEFSEPMDTAGTLANVFVCFDPDGEPVPDDPCDCVDNNGDDGPDEGCLSGYYDPEFWLDYDCFPSSIAAWSDNDTRLTFTPHSWLYPSFCETSGCEVFVQVGYVDVTGTQAQDVAGNNLVPAAPYPASLEEMQHRYTFFMEAAE